MPGTKERVYYVEGMHCVSCELSIERRLLELKGVKAADASSGKSQVLIEYEGQPPSIVALNKLFAEDGYRFSERPFQPAAGRRAKDLVIAFGVALVLLTGFVALERTGISGLLNVNASTSLPVFFAFGLVAGFSSCAALAGGLVLSMSKQWMKASSPSGTLAQRLQPHLLSNLGRLASYALLGALLGAVGSRVQLSLRASFVLVVVVSGVMMLLGLQMLGLGALRKLSIPMPKAFARYIARGAGLSARLMPLIIGASTFFLPCGFTITAQGVALLSGSALSGGLIMFLFALGTAPGLLAIGLSSATLLRSPRLSTQFSRVAGILVLFFALSNINAQFNALGLPSLNDLSLSRRSVASADADLPPVIQGKQLVTMEASALGYQPKHLKVRSGIPVRWEIKDVGTSGCTNAIISELFDGQIDLTPGKTSVREFTPTKPGRYKFSCWMGMVTGSIEVVQAGR